MRIDDGNDDDDQSDHDDHDNDAGDAADDEYDGDDDDDDDGDDDGTHADDGYQGCYCHSHDCHGYDGDNGGDGGVYYDGRAANRDDANLDSTRLVGQIPMLMDMFMTVRS